MADFTQGNSTGQTLRVLRVHGDRRTWGTLALHVDAHPITSTTEQSFTPMGIQTLSEESKAALAFPEHSARRHTYADILHDTNNHETN